MSKTGFTDALARALVSEGGYANHPADPGGATNRGVTQRVYDGYRTRRNRPTQSVKLISDAEVAEIYRSNYWARIRGDALPDGVDYVVLDAAVNSGPEQATRWLQRALGVQVDGLLGEATLATVSAFTDNDELIARFTERRLTFVRSLKTYKTFGRGWENRIAHVQDVGQSIATGSVGPVATYFAGAEAKALKTDAKKPLPTGLASMASGGGLVSSTISTATVALQPAADRSPTVGTVIVCLIVLGVAITAVAEIYKGLASKKNAEIADALDLHVTPAVPVSDSPVEPAAAQAA